MDSELKIEIFTENHDLIAKCRVHGPSESVIEEATIFSLLEEKRITFGIDHNSISELVAHYNEAGRKFIHHVAIIARGKNTTTGKPGYTDIKIKPSAKVTITEEGKADYRNIQLYCHTKKGDVLAEQIPSTVGGKGVDVYGRIIEPQAVVSTKMQSGVNVVFDEKTSQFKATCDGIFKQKEDLLCIEEVLVINHSVGLGTGNISYSGSVQVVEHIEREATICVSGDLEVGGVVESGKLKVGGSLLARSGINTKQDDNIIVKKNVSAQYIEHSNITMNGNLEVSYSIVNSNIIVGKKLLMSSPKSYILGGTVTVLSSMLVGNLGRSSGIATEIHMGSDEEMKNKHQNLKQKYERMSSNLSRKSITIAQLKNKLQDLGRTMYPHELEKIQIMLEEYKSLLAQQETLQKQMVECGKMASNAEPIIVLVKNIIYPGVTIHYYNLKRDITQEIQYAIIKMDPSNEFIDIEISDRDTISKMEQTLK